MPLSVTVCKLKCLNPASGRVSPALELPDFTYKLRHILILIESLFSIEFEEWLTNRGDEP
jgi:hypothetical protein